MITLTYYYHPECELCVPFLQTIQEVIPHLPQNAVALVKININEDELTRSKYHDKIPVLEINGRLAFKYHISKTEFLKALKKNT